MFDRFSTPMPPSYVPGETVLDCVGCGEVLLEEEQALGNLCADCTKSPIEDDRSRCANCGADVTDRVICRQCGRTQPRRDIYEISDNEIEPLSEEEQR